MSEEKNEKEAEEEGFISHLIELRGRLLKIVAGISLVLLCLLPFANKLYALLATPLLKYLPEGNSMTAIDVVSPFFIPFKLTMLLSVFITVPFILYHVWAFIAPGLYRKEKRLVFPLMLSSTLLFYAGVAFAYFVVFPLVFKFIIGIAPEGISVTPDISRYFDFVVTMFLAFGVAFEMPVATVILVAAGITTPEQLVSIRRYVIVAAFIVGMLLTPPDVISQCLLAFPMWVLYEIGVVASRLVVRHQQESGEEEQQNEA